MTKLDGMSRRRSLSSAVAASIKVRAFFPSSVRGVVSAAMLIVLPRARPECFRSRPIRREGRKAYPERFVKGPGGCRLRPHHSEEKRAWRRPGEPKPPEANER